MHYLRQTANGAPQTPCRKAWTGKKSCSGEKNFVRIASDSKVSRGMERLQCLTTPNPYIETRPTWAQTQGKGVPRQSIQDTIRDITPPGQPAVISRSQSLESDKGTHNDNTRLVETSTAEGQQCLDMLPSLFPSFRHVRNNGEMGS
jgi:hypothetical protein